VFVGGGGGGGDRGNESINNEQEKQNHSKETMCDVLRKNHTSVSMYK